MPVNRQQVNRQHPFRVGLVGAGHISRYHLRALARIPFAQVVGVADVDRRQAAALCDEFNLPADFASLAEMCEAGVDVVHILTPPDSHAPLAIEALERGCHVYVEKPLAVSEEDCDRIAEVAERQGRSVCVGHSLLWDPFIARARELVRGGAIGDVLAVDYFRAAVYPPYLGGAPPTPYRDGGYPFRDLGIHAIYLIEAFLGPIRGVQDRFTATGREPHLHFDEWRVLVDCQRGMGQVQLSWNIRPQQNVLLVQGTEGIVRADLFGMSTTWKRNGRLPEHARRMRNAVSDGRQTAWQAVASAARVVRGRIRQYHGLQALVHEFYESLAEGRPAPVDVDQARSPVRWTETIARRADAAKRRCLERYAGPLEHRVLITGASGLIGRALVKRLLGEGQAVRLLLRREPPAEWRDDARVEVVLGDLGDPAAVERAVAGVDQVYHLGAAMRGGAHDFDRGTIVGTRNVVDSVLRHGVRRLIHVSSLSVLEAARVLGDAPVTEQSPLEPFPALRGHYSRSKYEAERYVREAVAERGLRAVILRPAEVIGPGAPLITSGVAQRRGNRLIILGDGAVRVPMVHVDDLVDAIRLAAEGDIDDGSVFHIVDPAALTQRELVRRYVAASKEPLRVSRLPRATVFALALAVQTAAGMLRRPAPLSLYRVRSALAARSFDCAEAERRLGWRPKVGVEEGLRLGLAAESGDTAVESRAAAELVDVAAGPIGDSGEARASIESTVSRVSSNDRGVTHN